MVSESRDVAQVIFVVNNSGDVARSLLFSEFQAMLDGMLPAVEWSSQEAYAIYAEVNASLNIERTVFFRLQVEGTVLSPKILCVPFDKLAESGVEVTEYTYPFRLMTKEFCFVTAYKSYLWNPSADHMPELMDKLREVVQADRLGLRFESDLPYESNLPHSGEGVPAEWVEGLRGELSNLRHEQQCFAKKVVEDHRKDRELLAKSVDSQSSTVLTQLQCVNETLQLERQKNTELSILLDSLKDKSDALKKYYESKILRLQAEEANRLRDERFSLEASLEQAFREDIDDLKKQVSRREDELSLRWDEEKSLRESLKDLRQENDALKQKQADIYLKRLIESGVNFVIHPPGIGHIALSTQDMDAYLENSTGFIANHSGLKEMQYRLWLEHFRDPCCKGLNDSGEVCQRPITRVHSPHDFHVGEQDRCPKHKERLVKKGHLQVVNRHAV